MAWTAIRQRNAYEVATVDVYSGAGFYLAAALLLILRFLGKTTVAILHGGNLPVFHSRHAWQVVTLLKAASIVVTPSKYLFNYFQSHRSDIEYLPNGMDLAHYSFAHRTKVAPRICWLRAFDDAYDPLLAVHAFAIVRKRFPDAVLSMIGPVRRQELFDLVTTEAASLGLEQAVTFVGAIAKQDVPAELAAHDILLNTTTAESFGVAVMEAAASGLPIVSTSVGEIPYLWTHGTDALLVPPGNAEAMASAVIELLERPGLAGKLSLNARIKSEAYDWRVIVPQWLQLLQV
jgi:glycosyltransferase involved in cell wall biosynthesis